MQTASRDSFAAVRAKLDESSASPAELTKAADGLLAVRGLLVREPVLRRALSDPAAPAGIRVELLDAVVGTGLRRSTVDLLHDMVASRWANANDLVEACELLAVQALLTAAQVDDAPADALAEVEDELFRFHRLVAGDPQLRAALGESTAAIGRREGLVDDLLAGKARPVTVALVKMALGGIGGRTLEPSLERLVGHAAARRDREVAYVTVAAPMSTEQEQQLGAALARTYGRQMSLLITVDPSILGGMTVRVRQELYDGSIERRLKQVRGALAG